MKMILSVSWVEFRTPSLVLVAIATTAFLSLVMQKFFGRDMSIHASWGFALPDDESEQVYMPVAQNLVDVTSPNQLAFVPVQREQLIEPALSGPSSHDWSPDAMTRDEFFAVDHGEAYLLLKNVGEPSAARVPLSDSVVVGRRDPQSGPVDIDLSVVPGGEYVSRHHARIEHTDDGWRVVDINSANGVYVRSGSASAFGSRLQSPCPLTHGDDIAFAGVVATFHEVHHAPAQ